MKKLFAILMMMVMVLSLGACGGKEEKGSKEGFNAEKYGINLTSEELQPMSDDRATVEVLAETAKDWLGGATLFAYSSDKKSYNEFVEHIGCEPSEYQYDSQNNQRTFTWRAQDNDTAWFCAVFEEQDGKWELYATGSANLGIY